MTHTYKVSGMTCAGCQAKVQHLLSKLNGVQHVDIDLSKGEASIDMAFHIPTKELQGALKEYPKYQLSEGENVHHQMAAAEEEPLLWWKAYRPILLIFGYILAVTLLVEQQAGAFLWTRWMEHFMAGFFLAFSFFKMLDLPGFADSYSTYDIVAKRWRGWAFVYAFIELALGLLYLSGYKPVAVNLITFVVMSVSIIGVLQSVLNKRKIKCACLGAVFNLPMSTVTIVEDALMIGMSAFMLINMSLFK